MSLDYCGESFWDLDPNLNRTTTNFDFTECFKQTVLIYVPCLFLWLALIYEYFNVRNSSNLYIQWNFLNIGKLVLCFLLLISSVVELSFAIYDVFMIDIVYPVKYITPLIKACTYALAFSLILVHRKKGIHTSGSLFLFWTFMTVYVILNYRLIFSHYLSSNDNKTIKNIDNERSFIFKTIEFPIVLSQLFLAFFADIRSQFTTPGQEITNTCPKEFASFPNQMIFEWVTSIIRLGYRRPLKLTDMWSLNFYYKTDYVIDLFNKNWNRKKFDKNLNESVRRNVALVLFNTFWPLFLYVFILKFIQTILMFSSPVVLDYLITFMSSNDPDLVGYLYSFLLFFISFLEAIFANQYEFYLGVLAMKVKTCLMSTVYKKALVLSNDGRKQFNTGEIINLMAVDVQAVVDYINMINVLWSAPVQLLVCFYLLWQQLGIATLAGVFTLIALIPINGYYTNMMKKIQGQLMRQKDKRSKLIDEILNGIKIIKLYGWEKSFKEKISQIRNQEVKFLNSSAYYSMGITFAFSCTTFIVSLVSFATYILMDPNNVLTANKAFVTLSLLNLLRVPFALLPVICRSN